MNEKRIANGQFDHLSAFKKREDLKEMIESRKGQAYFYKTQDNAYLHPLNYRMLVKEFGGHLHLPLKLDCPIVEIEELQINRQNLKQFAYLDHLPSGSEI